MSRKKVTTKLTAGESLLAIHLGRIEQRYPYNTGTSISTETIRSNYSCTFTETPAQSIDGSMSRLRGILPLWRPSGRAWCACNEGCTLVSLCWCRGRLGKPIQMPVWTICVSEKTVCVGRRGRGFSCVSGSSEDRCDHRDVVRDRTRLRSLGPGCLNGRESDDSSLSGVCGGVIGRTAGSVMVT